MGLIDLVLFIGGMIIGIPIGMIIEHLLNERARNQSSTTEEE